MAITDIKKLNVRSPYYIEVVNEYLGVVPVDPDPDPDPAPEIPTLSTETLECSQSFIFGGLVGIKKFSLDTTDKQLGTYNFTIANAKVPIKYRVYTEGDTAPAYTTIGLDNWTNEWLAATGDNASSLSPESSNPNGVTSNFIYTTDAATSAISKNIIIELFAPIATSNNMNVTSVSCQPAEVAPAPNASDYVTVVTVATSSLTRFNHSTPSVNDVEITLNGTQYTLPDTNSQSGIRLITDDATPNYAVLSNNNPYSSQSNNLEPRYWSYTGLIPQEISPSVVNSGINELKIKSLTGAQFTVYIRIANHPVSDHPTISGQKVINHKGDGVFDIYLSQASKIQLMGNKDVPSEEEVIVKFSGVNQQYVVINEATYYHEVETNEGDSIDVTDDITSNFTVYYN